MGFQHGDGNEKLLTCAECSSPMELDAQFCVECGAKRTQAIGGKSANQDSEALTRGGEFSPLSDTISSSEEPVVKTKKARDPKVRIAIFSFADKTKNAINNNAKLVHSVSLALLILGIYGIIQTFIFSSSSPKEFGQKYIQSVIDRDEKKVGQTSEFFPNPDNLPLLPKKFQKWDEIDGLSWKIASDWNGWLGNGKIQFVPMDGNSIKETYEFSLPIKAKYRSKFLIFRTADWVAAEPMTTVKFALSKEKNIGVSINKVPAGSLENPELKEKVYAAFPGPLNAKLTGTGFTKEREKKVFLQSNNQISIDFPKVEYALSSSQVNSARTQLEANLASCLRRECSALPDLSQFDFTFSNQPADYLYTDYFYVDWSKEPNCTVSGFRASSASKGYMSLDCTAYAYGSIKWILYRIWLTTYYDTGYDSTSVSLTISADLTKTSNPYAVKLSNVQIYD